MKKACLLITLIISCLLIETTYAVENNDDKKICEPGSTRKENCNRCFCSENGLAWICPLGLCLPAPKNIAPNQPGFVCTPNKTFRFECNTCTCNEKGDGASCTEIGCLKNKYILQERRDTAAPTTTERLPATDQCIPGSRWKNDCNMCFCTETGVSVCTLRGCLGKVDLPTIQTTINHVQKKRHAINQDQRVAGGEVIYTLDDLTNPDFTCTPSLSFKVECNTCWCAADGKHPRFCTRIACNPKIGPTQQITTQETNFQSLDPQKSSLIFSKVKDTLENSKPERVVFPKI